MSVSAESIHISSLVIHCLPEKLTAVLDSTASIKSADIAAHDASGKIVVVLETESEQGILSIIDQIQAFKGVITATLVYHELGC